MTGVTRRGFLRSATITGAATLTARPLIGSGSQGHAQATVSQAQEGQRTIFFSFTVREGMQQEAEDLLRRVAPVSRAEPENLMYVFYQDQDDPRQFVLLEQWRSGSVPRSHFENLQAVFGPPRAGGSLPAAFTDLTENMRGEGYRLFA